jgi:hypothetical protein
MSLVAGQNDFHSVDGIDNNDGNGNEVRMTPNSVGRTEPYTGTYWHGTVLEIVPGVLNPGQVEPDLQLWYDVDGVDFSPYVLLDCSVSKCMLPERKFSRLGDLIMLGASMFQAAMYGNFGRANIPLNYTGPKVAQGINFHFSSTSGFTTGPNGTFASPPTIRLFGDVYDDSTWDIVAKALGYNWPGSINMQSIRRRLPLVNLPPYQNFHQVNGLNLEANFVQLPDGPRQGAVKVHRYFKYATPIQAVSGATAYPLTNLVGGVGGKAGQVGLKNELGYAFSKTQKALRIDRFGRRPGAGAGFFVLMHSASDIYPFDTLSGEVDDAGDPRIFYGLNYPLTGVPSSYSLMPEWGCWNPGFKDKEVIANEDAAFGVTAQSGQTIAANTDYTALAGVMVEA